jgi:hypothetical protein
MSIKVGMFLPTGSNVEPEPFFFQNYEDLQNAVGGAFDVVRTDLGREDVALLGYVNDTGLITGEEYNYLATALFKQNLVGNVVVTWGLSPNGEYDGDDYDIPESMVEFIQGELVHSTAEAYNLSVMSSLACQMAVACGIRTEDDIMDIVRGMNSADRDEANSWAKKLNEMLEAVIAFEAENPEAFGDAVQRLNEGEG